MYSFLLWLGLGLPVGTIIILRLLTRLFPSENWFSPEALVIIYLTQGVGLVANLAAIAFLIFTTTNLPDPIVNVVLHGMMGVICLSVIIVTAVLRAKHWL
jgi:hypothetical protein